MIIVKPSVEFINPPDYDVVLNTTELAIRNCYQSYDKMSGNSAEGLIRGAIKANHGAGLEFGDICVMIVCSRSTSHQLVRHRLCNFMQSSQRYVNYSKEKFGENIKVIIPKGLIAETYELWRASVLASEATYMVMIKDHNVKAEVARSVLPNCTATTICMKANIREWRHIFDLRCEEHSQLDIRELMTELLIKMYEKYPVFFEDLYEKFVGEAH